MFSVIICSIDPARFAAVKAMYERIFHGHDWELVHIPDARSLAEGYNRGISSSKGDILILSHDDLDIFSPDMPARLQRHLSKFDIVGIAGTTRLLYPAWHWSGPPYIFGQVLHAQDNGRFCISIYGVPFPAVGNIQAIDGVFMAARRAVFEKLSFDAGTFDGFHHYDIDFSYYAFCSGLRLAVVNDICIYHASGGKYDATWNQYAQKFHAKWLAGRPAPPRRQFRFTTVVVASRAEALEVMTPPCWRQIPETNIA